MYPGGSNLCLRVNHVYIYIYIQQTVAQLVKNLPGSAGDTIDAGSVSGLGRFPGERNGNPPLYSCLENSMNRGSWRDIVHGVSKELGRTEHPCTCARAHTHTHTHTPTPLTSLSVSQRHLYGEFNTPNCWLFYCRAVI